MKFGFTTLFTDKFIDTLSFYRDVLGFKVDKEYSPNPGVSIAFLNKDGNRIEIIHNEHTPFEDNSKSSIQLTFIVEDINEAFKMMKDSGVLISTEPFSLPSGLQMFHCKELNGITLGFIKEI